MRWIIAGSPRVQKFSTPNPYFTGGGYSGAVTDESEAPAASEWRLLPNTLGTRVTPSYRRLSAKI